MSLFNEKFIPIFYCLTILKIANTNFIFYLNINKIFFIFVKKNFPAAAVGSESVKEGDDQPEKEEQFGRPKNVTPVARRKNAVATLFSPERQLPEWAKFGTQ